MAEIKKKSNAGRPKKTLKDLNPEDWQEKALALMAEGGSIMEVRGMLLNISDDLYYRLMEEEEEFSRVIKKGQILSEVWWQKKGRDNLKDGTFSYTGWYMNMKNRFGWRDNHDVKLGNSDNESLKVTYKLDQ